MGHSNFRTTLTVLEKDFLKLFVVCLSRILTANSRPPYLKNSPTRSVCASRDLSAPNT